MLKKGLIFVISIIFLISCMGKRPTFCIEYPAKLDISNYNTIAIGDIVDQNGRVNDEANDLRIAITDSLRKLTSFDVIDRKKITDILSKQRFEDNIIIDDQNIVYKLRKYIKADLMIVGKITNYDCKSDEWQSGSGEDITYYSKERCNLVVNFKLIDIKRGDIVKTRSIKHSHYKSSSSTWGINTHYSDYLYSKATKNIAKKILRLFAPYKIKYSSVWFFTEKKLPELKQGIDYINNGNCEQALLLFEKATQKKATDSKAIAKAYYNLGKLQMYMLEYDKSISNLEHAVELKVKCGKPGFFETYIKFYKKVLKKAKKRKKANE